MAKSGRTTQRIFGLVLVLLIFSGLFSAVPLSGIASAVLPDGYVEQVADKNLDWYYSENFLNLNAVKGITDSWLRDGDYDWEAMERSPVIIAVIDSGIRYSHEIFQGKYDSDGIATDDAEGSYDVLTRDKQGGVVCANTVSKTLTKNVDDDARNKHGTHVAGIIANLIHALDLEKYIKIMPIKAATPSGEGGDFTKAAVERAIRFALDNGADVVNMSLSTSNSLWKDVVSAHDAEKAVFVAAAGNSNTSSSSSKYYPAASDKVIGVMNYTRNAANNIIIRGGANGSNYGDAYEICAPGTEIYSADGNVTDGYKSLNGTSMAAPAVAFAQALLTLKFRATQSVTDYKISPFVMRKLTVMHTDVYTLEHNGKQYRALDLPTFIGTDYLNDADYHSVMYAPLGIGFTVLGELEQTLGATSEITIDARVYPSEHNIDVPVDFYISDGSGEKFISSGNQLKFTPRAVGHYALIMRIEGSGIEERVVLTLNYKEITADAAEIQIRGDLTEDNRTAIGNPVLFRLKDFEFTNPDCSRLLWYVNGKYAAAGQQFRFSNLYGGQYVITAKLNEEYLLWSFTLTVDLNLKYDIYNVYTPCEMFSFVALAVLSAGLIILIIIVYAKGRKKGYF